MDEMGATEVFRMKRPPDSLRSFLPQGVCRLLRNGRAQLTWLLRLVLFFALLPAAAQAFWYDDRASEPASIHVSQLPPEARQTLALIKQGGPFPYAKDGTVFHNREGRLPARPRGYYREYTVVTPGARDRGARRIVAGRDGDYWYTADHYRTFKRIRE
jgi:ribonuclease T1